jgi:ADP-ribose pyrophosphatase YjhB (NUDIX family)
MIPPIDETWYTRPEGLPERVSAGGAVVRIDRGAIFVALVRERNEELEEVPGYILPKGRLESGEEIGPGALREIEEEAGLTEITLLGDLGVLERLSEKKTYWAVNHYGLYVTTQVSGEIKDPDHHFGFGWFPLDNLPEMYWPDERRLLGRNRKRIYEQVIAHQNPKARKARFM